jgi:hypothetical protein
VGRYQLKEAAKEAVVQARPGFDTLVVIDHYGDEVLKVYPA